MSQPFYITTPIYYVNAKPHLGHAYTTLVADVQTRFNAMAGRETFFLTGTDEHGDKIVRAAEAQNISPRAYVDEISALFRSLWPRLNYQFSDFIRTTDDKHIAVVQQILQQIYDSGDIYYSEYEGLYCFGCERFYTERELVEGKCPDHETAPEKIKESNYFFRMSRYQDWLINHIKENPEFIRPARYRNEVLAFLREPLEDLCVSRPKSRLKWGITLPFDEQYVTYVWFDALLNYVSALGYPSGERYDRFWPVAQHIVAKDILKPHGIYWPIMLRAAGLPLYQHLNVHGYWNVDASKMSKSLGNVVDPLSLAETYGLDAFRFFLMRDMVFGLDSSFSEDGLVQRYNADLANDLGNLASRVTAMARKYFKGAVPQPPEERLAAADGLAAGAGRAVDAFVKHMAGFAFHRALGAIWDFINQMNKYIDTQAPWAMAKDPNKEGQLRQVIYDLLEGLRVVAGLIYPVMPETAAKMQAQLGLTTEAGPLKLDQLRQWGLLAAGTPLAKAKPLFPRIDLPAPAAAPEKPSPPPADPQFKAPISLDEFGKVDLRVARIVSAEPIPKAKKLLKLEVDCGERRTVVAGLSQSYSPSDLIGKSVVLIANLQPAKLMGVESQGMILAAVDDEGVAVLTLDRSCPPGVVVR